MGMLILIRTGCVDPLWRVSSYQIMSGEGGLAMIRGLVVLCALAYQLSAAVAEPNVNSANYWIPFCRHAAAHEYYQGDAFGNGYCAGLVNGLGVMGRFLGACVPEGVTPEQSLRVVMQYLDQNPARTNENFQMLVVEALRGAWPCRQ
jgi:Ssp1 endopeptidase immunity protein Rap1a